MRSRVALSVLLLLVLIAPLVVLAEGSGPVAQLVADAYKYDQEVILINRNDGRIVVRDFAVGPNMVDLNDKYDAWGGPYYDLAAGDFNGDGLQELAVIGGGSLNTPGPLLSTFDPTRYKAGDTQLPALGLNIAPNTWQLVRCDDINGDGRDEIVAMRSANEPNISARIQAYAFNVGTGQWNATPLWDFPTAGGFLDMDLGDFDGDGKADLVLVRLGSYVYVLDGENPNITHFQARVGDLADWNKARIGDVDGDGRPELVLLRPQASASGNTPAAINIVRTTGGSQWSDLYGWGFPVPPKDIKLSDVDQDGKLEIMAFNNGSGATIYTLNPRLGGANNNIADQLLLEDNQWGPILTMGDANGDRRPERMLVRNNGALLRVYNFYENGNLVDEAGSGPYWDNFIAANLDGSGFQISARLSLPNNVYLYYDLSRPAGTQETIRVSNAGPGTFNWIAIPGSCPWLSMSRTVGAAGDTITFSLVPAYLPSLAAGSTLDCRVGVQASCTTGTVLNNNQTITVRLTILAKLYSNLVPVTFR
ncbi:MAG: FG-GAP repeat domain-containing protein [Anaerolineae bacterium]